ncbi:MAG: hypothetical protein M3422_06285 [Actinomycetota bacterium]|nr:hypothetical protein [Actinomycetota bacterium]
MSWRIDANGGSVIVTTMPPHPVVADHLWQPRVGPRIGVGVPLPRLSSPVDAIVAAVSPSPGANPWSAPGVNHTEGFAYVRGPVGVLEEVTGYRPLPRFVVAPHDLFYLGLRLAALLGRPPRRGL